MALGWLWSLLTGGGHSGDNTARVLDEYTGV